MHEISTVDDMKNIIKEVDLQIIHRRLQARKRNVTADGNLSKQQLANAYRGYHGLGSQYQALLQVSDDPKMHTNIQDQHLLFKHKADMKTFLELEKNVKNHSEKEVKSIGDDFPTKLAYHYVYKNHSLKRYNASKSAKPTKPRPYSDKPELCEMEWREQDKQTSIRPLGSMRQIELYKDSLKHKFPPIDNNPVNTNEIQFHSVNMVGDKTYESIQMGSKGSAREKLHITSFPNIGSAMNADIAHKYNHYLDDKASLTSAPAGVLVDDSDMYSDSKILPINFDMRHALMLMRDKEIEKYDKFCMLPSAPCVNNKVTSDEKKESWQRLLPETPKRSYTMIHGKEQNYSDFKKMTDATADVIDSWGHDILNAEILAMRKKTKQATRKENTTPTMERFRSNASIYRHFREYKALQKGQQVAQYQHEIDNSIIIRQMSPVPRAHSHIALRKNEYSRASTPNNNCEGTPISAKVGKLYQTTTEIFPSVSRPSSYRDVFEQPADLQERCMLTAAERIELEKLTRVQNSNNDTKAIKEQEQENNINKNVHHKPGRLLPQVPTSDKGLDLPDAVHEPMKKKEHVTNFTSDIQHADKEDIMINEIKPADMENNTNKAGSVSATCKVETVAESTTYTPHAKQIESSVQCNIPLPAKDFKRTKVASDVSDVYRQHFWPKLSHKMQFNYESFTRTSPEMKKMLEIRARNKRKIHLKNAQMAEESKRMQQNTVDSERPQTRVSFNENVIVFEAV